MKNDIEALKQRLAELENSNPEVLYVRYSAYHADFVGSTVPPPGDSQMYVRVGRPQRWVDKRVPA